MTQISLETKLKKYQECFAKDGLSSEVIEYTASVSSDRVNFRDVKTKAVYSPDNGVYVVPYFNIKKEKGESVYGNPNDIVIYDEDNTSIEMFII